MTVSLPQPGDLFEGRYRVQAQVGEGGFSKVFSAQDEQQGILVALKILSPLDQVEGSQGGNPRELADRFLREARVLSSLKNPHSIIMYDNGQTQDGQLYMVFEFIKGRSVFEMIRDDGPQHPSVVAQVLEGTLKSLQDAHAQGLLHRDVKPNNLMLAEQSGGTVLKVLDFGIAKAYGDASGAVPGNDVTAAGVLVGTPRYMPPEQLRGEAVGPPGDIYSLGIVALEMLTGKKAIQGRDRMMVIAQQMSHENLKVPPDVAVPARLKHVIERMLAKNVRIRYNSAATILRDLRAWTTDQPLVEPGNATQPVLTGGGLPPDEDKTFVTTINAATLDTIQHVDEATVLQTVNMAELERNVAASTSQDFDATFANPNVAAELANELEPTNERQALSPPPNWPPNPHATADSSGGFQRTPDSSGGFAPADSSGGFAPTPDQSGGGFPAAGQAGFAPQQGFGAAPGQGLAEASNSTPWDTSGQASLSARQNFTMPPTNRGAAFELTAPQKLVLGVSILIPGVAHLAFGQTKKGLGFLVVLMIAGTILSIVSVFLGLLTFIASAIVVFDAYLLLRAKSYREVADMEFFPDYKEFFS